ncbi:MAG TPA: LptF/LptG family permease [Pyrinomonadaceae bacterium]|nr:LptF/LptG family permease [Pyrinomonadaceae bacterium]
MPSRRLIERYVLWAILPYLCLAWLVLTGILLTQQVGKFSDLLGVTNAPLRASFDVAAGVIPNVSIFTIPMSMLIGTAAAFGRMGGDSEVVALRAAGVGTWRIVSPVLALGLLLSALTLFNGFEVAPAAMRSMRQSLARAALQRLESPAQPRTFGQLPGKVIYVRDGDEARGLWGRVFIYWLEAGRELRLVTARSGRIDNTGEQSELLLSDAVVTTLPYRDGKPDLSSPKLVSESSAELRIRLNTGKGTLAEKLENRREDPDEVDLQTLLGRVRSPEGGAEALSALHRRAALCTTPLAFALLGVGLGLRARRGGRGLAVLLSLFSMLLYYFVFIGGDYLIKTGAASPAQGAWLGTGLAFVCGLGLLATPDRAFIGVGLFKRRRGGGGPGEGRVRPLRAGRRVSLISGLMDRSIALSLLLYFAAAFAVMIGVFLIFTVFELLRFIAVSGAGAEMVARYLWYLVPLAGLSVTPVCALVAVLVTYSLMARRRETVAWWACGQSLYRMAVPACAFAALLSWGYWVVQERILPGANQRQDALRLQIRGGPSRASTSGGTQWLAPSDRSIYAYTPTGRPDELMSPSAYLFDEEGVHLRRVIAGERAKVGAAGLRVEQAAVLDLAGRSLRPAAYVEVGESVAAEMFKPLLIPASALNSSQLSEYIKLLKLREANGAEVVSYLVAKERRKVDPLAPLVMTIISIPLGTIFGRRSAVKSLFAAVVLGITFWGGASLFQQMGNHGLVPPTVAAFALPLLFTTIGAYIFSKTGT